MSEYSHGGMPSTVFALHTSGMGKAKRKAKAPNYFREWRKEKGLTQDKAASRSGLSQGTIAKLEAGKIGFTQGNLEALAHAYGCEPADLLRPPNPPDSELATYLMKMDGKTRQRALKIIKAIADDSEAA